MENQKEINDQVYLRLVQEHEEKHGSDDEDDWFECTICGGEDGDHELWCPDNDSPYARLQRDGYD
jgi:hypothetical protein